MSDFDERLLSAADAVYARIEDGQVTDVEAELMQAHYDASDDDD